MATAGTGVVDQRMADVGRRREQLRRRRLWLLAVVVGVVGELVAWRLLSHGPFLPLPHVDPFLLIVGGFFGVMLLMMVLPQLATGRSPHVVYRSDQIDTRLADVVGIDPVKDDVVRSLNLFLAHKTYTEALGGTPRRGLLFEGPPGTGKTHLARAMAAEAGVPFLFASGTSFQTVWQGQSSKKIRSYFKALRKAALKEGGAIGFIEEIDVIAASRSGVSTMSSVAAQPMSAASCCAMEAMPASYGSLPGPVVNGFTAGGDTSAIINELLVQMQSFDALTGSQKLQGWFIDRLNALLPPARRIARPTPAKANVLLIAATNRASSLDPALLRPGRFDRLMSFEPPSKSGRRQLVDYFLTKKAHAPELDDVERRDALAAITIGYTPVMIENLFDEALVNTVRRGADAMTWKDLEQARLTTSVGTGQPVEYTDHERRLIATHEAGHATAAWLTAPHRRLEVLTIIKRKGSLGLLAHGDREDVFTRSRTEMQALVQIALGGQCAEELFFGDISTGPGGDLLYATNAAAEMIGAHGMEHSLVSYLAVQNSGFSDTNIVGRVLGDPSGRTAVEDLLHHHKTVVRALLAENRHLVEALRDALLAHDELIGHEITDVLESAAAAHADRVVDLRDVPALPSSTAL